MYTDSFLEPAEAIDRIRLASVRDIIAMKMNVVSRGGRKKDFWDLHLLLNKYSLAEMLSIMPHSMNGSATMQICYKNGLISVWQKKF